MTATIHSLTDGSLLCWTVVHPDVNDTPIRTGLRWNPSEPLVIMLEFCPREKTPVIWRICRDMLCDGMTVPTGEWDVTVYPASPPWVAVGLSSPSGSGTFAVDAGTLRAFLTATFLRCPRGAEFDGWDVDAWLSDLLLAEGA